MKTINYISIKSILNDFTTKFKSELSEGTILEWANQAVNIIIQNKDLQYNMEVLELDNYSCELPDNIRYIDECIVVPKQSCNNLNWLLVEYNQKVPDRDCIIRHSFEYVSDKCDDCKFDCDRPKVIIEKPPTAFLNQSLLTSSFVKNKIECIQLRPCNNKIKLSSYWLKEKGHCDNCVQSLYQENTEDCFNLINKDETKKIITTIKSGTLLISYLSNQTDNDGYLLVPDVEEVINAITLSIAHQEALYNYSALKTKELYYYLQEIERRKLIAIKLAFSKLNPFEIYEAVQLKNLNKYAIN